MNNKKIYRCYRRQNVLWLRVAIGKSGDTPLLVRLLVDTGASYTVLPTRILQRIDCNLEQPLEKKKIVTANGVINVPLVAVPWFNCLGRARKNYPVVALSLPASSFTDGLLGMDYLTEVGAVIDVANAEIRLKADR
ncbi:MAG: retropepsin-like aspartic protease [Cyanobacteria bacterium P01_C01_bin.72]